MDPGQAPDEVGAPPPDTDIPDPGDGGETPGLGEAEAHPS
jgi:hypothetical protein